MLVEHTKHTRHTLRLVGNGTVFNWGCACGACGAGRMTEAEARRAHAAHYEYAKRHGTWPSPARV